MPQLHGFLELSSEEEEAKTGVFRVLTKSKDKVVIMVTKDKDR